MGANGRTIEASGGRGKRRRQLRRSENRQDLDHPGHASNRGTGPHLENEINAGTTSEECWRMSVRGEIVGREPRFNVADRSLIRRDATVMRLKTRGCRRSMHSVKQTATHRGLGDKMEGAIAGDPG